MNKVRPMWHNKEIFGELDIDMKIGAFWKGQPMKPMRYTYNAIPGTNSLPPGHYVLIRLSDKAQR